MGGSLYHISEVEDKSSSKRFRKKNFEAKSWREQPEMDGDTIVGWGWHDNANGIEYQ